MDRLRLFLSDGADNVALGRKVKDVSPAKLGRTGKSFSVDKCTVGAVLVLDNPNAVGVIEDSVGTGNLWEDKLGVVIGTTAYLERSFVDLDIILAGLVPLVSQIERVQFDRTTPELMLGNYTTGIVKGAAFL